MKIKEIAIKSIKEYKNNPRINDEAVEYVANSIKEFGFRVPIIIDENKVIVAGHTRVRAAERLGLTKVYCIIADDLSPEQTKAFRLADNKTSELSSWDEDKLFVELMELDKLDFQTEKFGFEVTKLSEVNDIPEVNNQEMDLENYSDESFEHECPKCGFRFNE